MNAMVCTVFYHLILTSCDENVKIIFDKESRLLHGKLVDIKDLVTFEGQDSEEIERAFHEAVEDYIEMRLDLQGGKTV